MRHYYQSVLERRHEFTEPFATEPFEAGWASEAIFFLIVEKVSGEAAELSATVQISPAGSDWVDEGSILPPITKEGTYFVKIKHFGGWLRLNCMVKGKLPIFKTTVHLVLKE